jgi:hypothetical protein
MATLHYLQASRVEGATKYNLYKSDVKGNILGTNPITSMELLQEFPFLGAITDNGNVREKENTLFALGGSENSVFFTPLRRLTESGVRYCLKVSGTLSASVGGGVTERRIVDAVWDFPDGLEVDSFTACYIHIHPNNSIEKKDGDGYYLNCSLTAGANSATNIQIRIFDLDPIVKDIGFGKGDKWLTLHGGEVGDNRRHTEYIPTYTLIGNNWVPDSDVGAVCVGGFNLSNDGDYSYKKMAFYNKNLKYVGGADNDWLSNFVETHGDSFCRKDSQGIVYFTSEGVDEVGVLITGTSNRDDENYPEFVVFSSRASRPDYVCFGEGYFPLFAMPDSDFGFVDGYTHLVVTADSVSQYYKESNPSIPVTYARENQS